MQAASRRKAIESAPAQASATITPFPRKRLSDRRRAAMRLSELSRLSLYCVQHQLSTCSRREWLYVLAATLSFAERREQAKCVSDRRDVAFTAWPGLDFISLKDAAHRAGLTDCPHDEIEYAMNAALKWKAKNGARLLPPRWLGNKVQLTSALREELNIRGIDACDETKEERMDRLKERRREKDREAKRAKRGSIPREQYESQSLSRTKPWEAEGISRRTWERRRAKGTTSESLSIQSPSSSFSHQDEAQPDCPEQGVSPAEKPSLRGQRAQLAAGRPTPTVRDAIASANHIRKRSIGAPTNCDSIEREAQGFVH